MVIKQLSVFIENKSGRLYEVMQILGDEGINVSALSIADTSEYGIARIIVTEPSRAVQLLKEQDFSVQVTPVICCKLDDKPGELKRMLGGFSEDNISIEYMYAFSKGEDALIILRAEDCDKAIESLTKHHLEIVRASDIYQI
ncbi:acetolactate synthase [Cellulosilyticum ruminicola]|uniref:acetolactate synthase n=1 Tax=Cellulosilyticum ruminicola TaxID=425254 RepID=UPI0006CFB11B|nr:acetolactate synthase [Cellulosilyticum ruminicola]